MSTIKWSMENARGAVADSFTTVQPQHAWLLFTAKVEVVAHFQFANPTKLKSMAFVIVIPTASEFTENVKFALNRLTNLKINVSIAQAIAINVNLL